MKNKSLQILSLVIMAMILTAVSANAQTSYQADIPFDFMIGNKTFASGEYQVTLKTPTQLSSVLTVKNVKTRATKEVPLLKSGAISDDGKTILVFNRIGDQFVLNQIAAPEYAFNAPKPNRLTRLAKMAGEFPETVAIALLRREKDVE